MKGSNRSAPGPGDSGTVAAVSGSDVREALAEVTAALPGGGEARPGQVAMAEAVAGAIDRGRHLVVQAGTGTGKSLAYLVPAILSGRRTVVATATKALQDQLATKDLPFLAAHLARPFAFSVVKGRSNYLCLQKATEIGAPGEQLALDDDLADDRVRQEVVRILEWAKRSPTGDRAELAFEPSARAWSAVSVGASECPGATRCPMGEPCFAEAARRRADEADVVVVNTHLYGVHLASGGFVLGDHDVVVFDEAHQLEDVAAHTMGVELSAGRFRALARALRAIVSDADSALPVDDAGRRLEEAIVGQRGQRLVDGSPALDGVRTALALATERVNAALATVRAIDPPPGPAAAKKQRAMKAATSLLDDVEAALALDENHVAWVEGPEHAPVLKVATVEVGERLAAAVWSQRTAILTSATVPPGLAARVGLAEGSFDSLDAGSPFDYQGHALLYVAAHLPEPRSPRYEAAMLLELERLIRAAGGRTLALFTSWRMMTTAADALRGTLPWPVLTQADLPKPALLRQFAEDEASCLFATMGFWQGVDVPGPALSLVVLDKLPFPRPDEPLTQARRDRAGPAAFAVVDLPRAATILAQGAGRLIRTATDRGVVAVLDPRLAAKDYRRQLLAPVPPMKRTVTFAHVQAFLRPDASPSDASGLENAGSAQ
jgi:ATP-dependent DNA helicase DinG